MEKINVVYFRAKRAEIGGERGWNKDRDSHDGGQQCTGGEGGCGIVIEEEAR